VPNLALIGAGAYLTVAALAYAVVLPLLRVADASDEALDGSTGPAPPPPPVEPAASEVRMELAYAALSLDRLVLQSAVLLGAEEVCFVLRGERGGRRMVVVAQHGMGPDVLGEPLPEGHELALRALSQGRPVAVPGGRFSRAGRPGSVLRTEVAAATPVAWHGAVRGALSVRFREGVERIRRSELELLSELGGLAGVALEHRRRRELTDADTGAEVRLLLEAVSRADPYTSRHADDVAALATWVGGELGLDRLSTYELELTAALHDVGKLRVPRKILQAPRRLTDGEREVMAMHPVWSFEIVSGVPGLEAVAPLVRAHHERWDGGGYPDGLAGERIPLASRIVAACDAVGALTSDRPYRRGTSLEEAVRELTEGSGTQFDPQVVSVIESAV
jgi:GAF domain-containing protein